MEFIALLQNNEWLSGLTIVLVISLVLLGPYILAGLSTALEMLKGKLKTEIISGRLGPLDNKEWFAVSSYGRAYKNVSMELDGFDQPVIFKKLQIGPKLRRNKALQPGDRYIMLVRKRKKGFNRVDLLAASNGRDIFLSRKDICTLYELDWAQVFFLGFIGPLIGLRFLAPLLTSWGNDLEVLIVALACGLAPALALLALYRRAATKFMSQARARLEDFARTWDPEGGLRPAWAIALSLPVDKHYDWEEAVSGISSLIQPLGFVLAFMYASVTMINDIIAAFTMPGFELRPLRLESFDEIRKDTANTIYLKNAVMRDTFSGTAKAIKKLFPTPDQFQRRLLNPGLTGLWMIRIGALGHSTKQETKGSLKVAGYAENTQEAAEVLIPARIASLYIGPLYKVPIQAGFFGAAALISATLILTGSWPSLASYLWLIPWAALSTFLKFMARHRISAAVAECLSNSQAGNKRPILPGMVNRGTHDPQTL